MAKSDTKKPAPSSENESVIRLRGKTVEWRGKPEFRYPVDIRIMKNAKKHDTRSVHAAVNTPGEKLVAFCRGRVLPCSSGLTKISGKWFITLPMPWLVRARQSDNGGLVVGEVLERRSSGRIFQFQPAIRL